MAFHVNLFTFIQFSQTIFMSVFPIVLGCGQFPQGQVSLMRFTFEGTILPVEMAYSETGTVQVSFSTINRNENVAKTAVERQIMGAVEDVLEEEGRSALLPPFLISQILQQLNISINYIPINCAQASSDPAMLANFMMNMPEGCIIIGGNVIRVCSTAAAQCNAVDFLMVPSRYTTFRGELRTSNVVMANWSRQMKESVFNRVRRRLSSLSTPFGMFCSRATITLNN